jgi:prepilin-type N-terminal cleavage/methylation domain-containing protein
MSDRSKQRARGFSLVEMMIAMIAGTVVLGGAISLYSSGASASFTVSQQAELQQDFRAAGNILKNDISMAGAGLSNQAIALPAATTPVYGCDQTGACYLGAANSTAATYPVSGGVPYIYGLIPGLNAGPAITTPPGTTDAITVVYTDTNFLLNCYQVTLTSAATVTFTEPGGGWLSNTACVFPNNAITAPQAVNDANVGLTAGDLVLFNLGGTPVVAEVTGGVGAGAAAFAAGDALHMNQASTVANSLAYEFSQGFTTGYAYRLLVISYYLDNTPTPPRLMRQVNGHTPMPVTDGLVYLKFSYDLYNGTLYTNQADGGVSLGLTPSAITKINILNMAMDSELMGKNGYVGLSLQTSVSARNLTFVNKYPCTTNCVND